MLFPFLKYYFYSICFIHIYICMYLGSTFFNFFIWCYPSASLLYPARQSFESRKRAHNSVIHQRYPSSIFPQTFSQMLAGRFQILIHTKLQYFYWLGKKKKDLSFNLMVQFQKHPTHMQLIHEGRRKEEEGIIYDIQTLKEKHICHLCKD